METRKASFAGSWYPGDPKACEKEIKDFLKQAETVPKKEYVGGIVPHAGWYFSGQIACNVINCLKYMQPVDVFIVFGMHLPPGAGNFIMTEGAWETPFGDLEIETDLAEALTRRFTFTVETATRFTQDNTIELQLPFIKYLFPESKIVPMGVPPDEKSLNIGKFTVKTAHELGLNIRVIGSTDLTHYGSNYGFAPKGQGREGLEWMKYDNDRKVIEAMMALDPETVIREGITNHNACCSGAAATAIAAGKALGAEKAETVAYATSYDKHPGDSFVGYVGIVF